MRFVTLNLDRSDADSLRSAVEIALTTCSCRMRECPRCDALDAIHRDLDRLLGRRDARGHEDGRAVAGDAARTRLAVAEPPSPPAHDPTRHLWLVPATTPDA